MGLTVMQWIFVVVALRGAICGTRKAMEWESTWVGILVMLMLTASLEIIIMGVIFSVALALSNI